MVRNEFKIFEQGMISNLVTKNRLVRSATCEYKMTHDGKPTDLVLKIYKDLAEGGVGIIITSLFAVSPDAHSIEGQGCIYNDDYIPKMSKIPHVVHQADSKCIVIAQLCHCGRQITHDNTTTECVGPSAVKSSILEKQARELSTQEVKSIIKAFADSIIRVKKAGFDGAQLHAAHGYLLSSFLSPYTNKRTDEYGGSDQNRVKIIKDIIELARKDVSDFPILIKMNCDDHVEGGISKETFPALAKEVQDTGVDALEISGAMWDCLIRSQEELGFFPAPIPESRIKIDDVEKQSYYYDYVKDLKLDVPVILVGGHRNIDSMEKIIQEGNVNFLSLSRPFLSEPDLPNRWLNGKGSKNANCVSCNACIVFKDGMCGLKAKGIKKEMFEERFISTWRDVFK